MTGYRFFRAEPEEVAEALRDHVDEVEIRGSAPRQGKAGSSRHQEENR
jgi:hypothetical protein